MLTDKMQGLRENFAGETVGVWVYLYDSYWQRGR